MIARMSRGHCAVILILAGLFSCLPGKAQAQEILSGHWVAVAPQGVNTSYTFGTANYITLGTWRGCYTLYWANCPIASGEYELRIITGNQATLGLKDGVLISTQVASVDLGTRTMTFKGVTYRP